MKCRLCDNPNEDESEIHLLNCIKIQENIESSIDLPNAKYEQIYSDNLEDQVNITKIFDLVFKTRRRILGSK